MSDEHKAALAKARMEGRGIRDYLDGLRATKPKRGRKRTPETIRKRLDAIDVELASASPLDEFENRHLINSFFGVLLLAAGGWVAGQIAGWRAATIPAIGCDEPGEKTSHPWPIRIRVNRRVSISTRAWMLSWPTAAMRSSAA